MPRFSSSPGNVVKATLFKVTDGVISEEYAFQYNFGELYSGIKADYTFLSPPGSFLPTAIYSSTPGKDLSFSLLVDKTDRPTLVGVQPDMAFFESLVTPDIGPSLDSGARWTSPPRLILVVGVRSWDIVCTSVNIRETMYNRGMTPVRAYIDFSFTTIFTSMDDARNYLREMRDIYSPRVVTG